MHKHCHHPTSLNGAEAHSCARMAVDKVGCAGWGGDGGNCVGIESGSILIKSSINTSLPNHTRHVYSDYTGAPAPSSASFLHPSMLHLAPLCRNFALSLSVTLHHAPQRAQLHCRMDCLLPAEIRAQAWRRSLAISVKQHHLPAPSLSLKCTRHKSPAAAGALRSAE